MSKKREKVKGKSKFQEIGDLFRLPGEVKSISEIREAKTNSTFKVTYSTGREYIFQNLNIDPEVDLEKVMKNIDLVTSYLRERSISSLHFHHTNDQANFVKDNEGDYWRVRQFVDSYSYKTSADLNVIEEVGFAIGDLLRSFKAFDVTQLSVNYESVHQTRPILEKLKENSTIDVDEVSDLLSHIDDACKVYDLYVSGKITPTVTHNDAKIKNVLFDKKTRKPLVVIDLDMVQPGIGIYDFASAVIHLCKDVEFKDGKYSNAVFNLEKFVAFLKGYLKVTKYILTDIEKENLSYAVYAIACEAAAINFSLYSQNQKENRLFKGKMYVSLAKDVREKIPEMDKIIQNILVSIQDEYKMDINSLDRDISFDKQKEYQPGEYMDIVIPHKIHVKGGKAYAFFKRTFDIFASLLAIIILSPIFLVVGLIVKFTSKGPMIYISKRVGKNGRIFKFYKFRSMYKDAESRLNELLSKNEVEGGITFKMKNDPRITPFGKFIRKTSLDELPQLFNILKGDMSIIGPRVGLPREVELYPEEALDRLQVPQGLSGEWQANGRSDTTFDNMIKMDLDYIQNKRGFWYDIGLIFKTIWVVITGKGAE